MVRGVRKLIWDPTEIWPPTFTWIKLLLPSWKGPLPNCQMQSLFHWATAALDNIYKLSLKCYFSLASALSSSSGLLWLLSPSPSNHLYLPTLYILGPPRALSLAFLFLPFYLYLLHGPPHPLADSQANYSQQSISSPFSNCFSILTIPNCLQCPKWHFFFLKPFLLSTSRNVNLLSLPAVYLGNFCMLIKVQCDYCILSYALSKSGTLCLHSLIVMSKACLLITYRVLVSEFL